MREVPFVRKADGLALAANRLGHRRLTMRAIALAGLMLAARITLPHFSTSSAMSLPKSVGEPGSGEPPNSAIRVFILGSARPVFISLLSFSMISAGVAFGAPMPNQLLAS